MKLKDLKAVEDLTVYKKNLKNGMVGIRWSYLDNINLNGFIVTFNENDFNTSFVIAPTKCSAWPKYYCHTFQNFSLSHSHNYTFKVSIGLQYV